jgi:hypothetical protein
MIHRFNPYRNSVKNLFLGEEMRVFMAGGGTGSGTGGGEKGAQAEQKENEEVYTVPTIEQAFKYKSEVAESLGFIIREVKASRANNEMFSNEGLTKSGAWERMLTEFRGFDGMLDRLEKLLIYVEGDDFEPTDPRWKNRFQRILDSYPNLEKLKQNGGNFLFSTESLKAMRENRKNEVKNQHSLFVSDLKNILGDLKRGRQEVANEMKEAMLSDLDKRSDSLRDLWIAEPSSKKISDQAVIDFYDKDVKAGFHKIFDDYKGNPKEMVKQLELAHKDLDQLENDYLFRTGREHDNEKQNSIESIDSELRDLEAEIAQTLTPEFLKGYQNQVDQVVRGIDELAFLATKNIPDKENRDKALADLALKKAKFQESTNIDEHFKRMLNDATTGTYPEGATNEAGDSIANKPITFNFKGKDYAVPNGLRNQINFLKGQGGYLPMSMAEDERKNFINGIKGALHLAKDTLSNVVNEQNQELKYTLEKIELEKQRLNEQQPKGKKWDIIWLAPADIKRAVDIIGEWAKRKHTRASDNRVGRFGTEALKGVSKLPYLRTLPNDFDKKVESSEQEEVNSYKEVYSNKDAWQVEEVLHKTKNIDEMKACLILLSEKGRLRWDNENLLRQLNRFQSVVEFSPNLYYEMKDLSVFNDKLNRAIGTMYDFDTYNELKGKNASSYESAKKNFDELYVNLSEQEGGISGHLKKLLTDHVDAVKDGKTSKVDPTEYEMGIDKAIEMGKMSSEAKLYYLIQGIAQGILTADRGSALNGKYINTYPAIDLFGSSTGRGPKPTFFDVKEWASYDGPPDKFEPGDMYLNWFHTKVLTLPRVTQRIDKTLTQGNKLDHDDLTPFLAWMGEATTETMMKAHADGFRLPQTGVQNGTVALANYMDIIAEDFDNNTDYYKKDLARFAGSFARYNGILMNHMYKDKQGFFRIPDSALDGASGTPRAAGSYEGSYGRGGGVTTRENLNYVGKYLGEMDEVFLKKLYSGQIKTPEDVQKVIKNLKAKYGDGHDFFGPSKDMEDVKTVDDLFTYAGSFVEWLVENQSHQVTDVFSKIRQHHQDIYAKNKASGKKPSAPMGQRLAMAEGDRELLAAELSRRAQKGDTSAFVFNKESESANNSNWHITGQ